MKAIAQIIYEVRALNVGPGARTLNREQAKDDASKALRNVKGKVDMVDGNEIWVSLGGKNGLAKGDTIKVYRPNPKKNKKGDVITTSYEEVGEIKLATVQKEKSMGRYAGSVKIEEDWAAAETSVNIDEL